MGSGISDTMKKNMEENSNKMLKNQKAIFAAQRELMMASAYARMKDMFYFYSGFQFTMLTIGIIGFRQGRKEAIAPVLIFTWPYLQQVDNIYFNKRERILKMAEDELKNNPELYRLPEGNLLMDLKDYDELFIKNRNKNK